MECFGVDRFDGADTVLIQIYFKGDYGLIIESELDEGTTVTIHLPKVPIDEYRKEEDAK